jgi:hypothetical protein
MCSRRCWAVHRKVCDFEYNPILVETFPCFGVGKLLLNLLQVFYVYSVY